MSAADRVDRGGGPRRGAGTGPETGEPVGEVRLAEAVVDERLGLGDADVDGLLVDRDRRRTPPRPPRRRIAAACAEQRHRAPTSAPRTTRGGDPTVGARRPRRRVAVRAARAVRHRRSRARHHRVAATRASSARPPTGSVEVVQHERRDDGVEDRDAGTAIASRRRRLPAADAPRFHASMSCERSTPTIVATPAARSGASPAPVPAPTSSTRAPVSAIGERADERAAIGA